VHLPPPFVEKGHCKNLPSSFHFRRGEQGDVLFLSPAQCLQCIRWLKTNGTFRVYVNHAWFLSQFSQPINQKKGLFQAPLIISALQCAILPISGFPPAARGFPPQSATPAPAWCLMLDTEPSHRGRSTASRLWCSHHNLQR